MIGWARQRLEPKFLERLGVQPEPFGFYWLRACHGKWFLGKKIQKSQENGSTRLRFLRSEPISSLE